MRRKAGDTVGCHDQMFILEAVEQASGKVVPIADNIGWGYVPVRRYGCIAVPCCNGVLSDACDHFGGLVFVRAVIDLVKDFRGTIGALGRPASCNAV